MVESLAHGSHFTVETKSQCMYEAHVWKKARGLRCDTMVLALESSQLQSECRTMCQNKISNPSG